MSSRPWQPGLRQGESNLAAPRIARILGPGAENTVSAIEWRQVGAPPARGGTAEAPAADPARLDALRAECEQRVREARAAGAREAENAAKTRAAAEVQTTLEKFAHSAADLAQLRSRLRKQAEGDAVRLALAIARRVIRRELAVDPEAIRGLVVAGLEKLQAQEIYRVRASRPHAAAVTKILQEMAGHIKIETVADGSLQPGSVIFETNHGNLDASVDSQLGEIERGLADHLHQRS